MTVDEYIKARLDDQIDWYDRKSSANQRWFKRLRLAEIMAAAAIPVLSGFVCANAYVPVVVGGLGGAVAIMAGAMGLYQFEQLWAEYRGASESLKREKFLFLTGSGPFDKDPDENYRLLVERVEGLLGSENANWSQNIVNQGESDGAAPMG